MISIPSPNLGPDSSPIAEVRRFAGVDLASPAIMGIVNVTPDSFSDGGRTLATDDAVALGLRLIAEGAAIVDVGGESTRPGASPVDPAEEMRRVLPVIEALVGEGAVVSADTRNASVMPAAIDAGAVIVNDVSALEGDGAMRTLAKSEAAIVLMHMQGTPATMNDDPRYGDVVAEVLAYLAGRVAACEAAGIARARIAVDPGIGFGKTADHNRALLDNIGRFAELDCPVLVGVSRKMPESTAVAVDAAVAGARILRVHDVAKTREALGLRGFLTT